jgi:hypothetical protein
MDATTFRWITLTFLLGVAGLAAAPEQANPKTAFELIKAGNEELAPKARDQVLYMESEPSEYGLVPTIWRIVYYDQSTAFDSRSIVFQNNRLEKVGKPFRPTQPLKGTESVIPLRWRKVDSDKVLEIVAARPEVKDLKLLSSQMWLKWEQGQPVWKVKLWAKHYFTDAKVEIGDLFVSPSTGEVMLVDLDLKPLSKR